MKMKKYILITTALLIGSLSYAGLATFDGKDTGIEGYYKPAFGGNYDWQDGGATFGMDVDPTYLSWEGFTYSDVNDTTTVGWGNQYAVYGDGLDFSGTGNYAVSYAGGAIPTISLGAGMTAKGFYANNTTYAALDMINGSGFSKAFSTNDWFKLTVEGFDAGSSSQGTVDFLLADFTGYTAGDNKDDYIVNDWAWVDLTSLGSNVSSLAFSLSSSDVGGFGMNTPAYFAIDNFEAIPEPGTIVLMLLSSVGFIAARRFRN
jgi:hypothetical protein